MRKKIVVFTGAGISAESGIQTFRDSDGLWEGHNVEDVATPMAFKKNPKLVLQFYNERRKKILEVLPNDAHLYIAKLETYYDVEVITQNIDDLHERAGSTKVTHLHGEIFKMCSEINKQKTFPIYKDIQVGDVAEDGAQLRPFIVWFHEEVPLMSKAIEQAATADICIVVGTSMVVYPAASVVNYLKPHVPIYVVDKRIPKFESKNKLYPFEGDATIGMKKLYEELVNEK